MRVEFSPRAYADLENIGDHIAKDNPANANSFVNKLIDRCLDISHAPEGYIKRPELGRNIRSIAFRNYMIFYTFKPNLVRIERILHGSRDYLDGASI